MVSAAEAIELLDISRKTLDRIVAQGKLPTIRLGPGPKAHRRFRRDDVLALLEPDVERAG